MPAMENILCPFYVFSKGEDMDKNIIKKIILNQHELIGNIQHQHIASMRSFCNIHAKFHQNANVFSKLLLKSLA